MVCSDGGFFVASWADTDTDSARAPAAAMLNANLIGPPRNVKPRTARDYSGVTLKRQRAWGLGLGAGGLAAARGFDERIHMVEVFLEGAAAGGGELVVG